MEAASATAAEERATQPATPSQWPDLAWIDVTSGHIQNNGIQGKIHEKAQTWKK